MHSRYFTVTRNEGLALNELLGSALQPRTSPHSFNPDYIGS